MTPSFRSGGGAAARRADAAAGPEIACGFVGGATIFPLPEVKFRQPPPPPQHV